ncbi:hypothetical protein IW262DRAFT_1280823 [Armillaria fumosa]|nr:hypothetical protein IW262DRAFT_1280823 [Armillaria fumosa]
MKRHLNMIAVGGSIGTGVFVGSGCALHTSGPAGGLIAWILISILLINVTQVRPFFLSVVVLFSRSYVHSVNVIESQSVTRVVVND